MLSGEEAGGDPCWVEYSCSPFDLDTHRETMPDARTCFDHALVDVADLSILPLRFTDPPMECSISHIIVRTEEYVRLRSILPQPQRAAVRHTTSQDMRRHCTDGYEPAKSNAAIGCSRPVPVEPISTSSIRTRKRNWTMPWFWVCP